MRINIQPIYCIAYRIQTIKKLKELMTKRMTGNSSNTSASKILEKGKRKNVKLTLNKSLVFCHEIMNWLKLLIFFFGN